MSLDKPKYILMTVSLVALVLALILAFEIYSIRIKSYETSELLNLADETAKGTIRVQSIRTMQNNSAEDLAVLDNLILSETDLVPFIESIEQTGRGLGLNTTISSLGKVEDKKNTEASLIRIVVESEGSWGAAFGFMRAIENMPYRIIIDEANLSKVENAWRLKMVLSLNLLK